MVVILGCSDMPASIRKGKGKGEHCIIPGGGEMALLPPSSKMRDSLTRE